MYRGQKSRKEIWKKLRKFCDKKKPKDVKAHHKFSVYRKGPDATQDDHIDTLNMYGPYKRDGVLILYAWVDVDGTVANVFTAVLRGYREANWDVDSLP